MMCEMLLKNVKQGKVGITEEESVETEGTKDHR